MWVRVCIFTIDLFLRRQNPAFDLFAVNTCKWRVYGYISHIIDTQRDSEKSIVKIRGLSQNGPSVCAGGGLVCLSGAKKKKKKKPVSGGSK